MKKKIILIICIFTMLFSLTACKGTPATKNTVEKKLQNSYWYIGLLDNTAYLKFEFHDNGVCDITVLTKAISLPIASSAWKYDYGSKKLKVGLRDLTTDITDDPFEDEDDVLVFAYIESGDFFELESENYLGDAEEMGLFYDTLIGEFFSCNKNYETLDAEAYIHLKTIDCGPGDYRGEYSTMIDVLGDTFTSNIEKTTKQKDESAIEEIRNQMEIVLWENIDYWDIGAVITYNDITNMDISIMEPDSIVVDSETTEEEVRAFLETVASEVDDYEFTSKIYIANPKVTYVIENERVKVYRDALREIPSTSYDEDDEPKNGRVPSLIGKTYEEAKELLNEAGYNIKTVEEYSNIYESGIIFSQSINAGEIVPPCTQIIVTVSKGPNTFKLENLVGMKLDDAIKYISDNDLRYEINYTEAKNEKAGVVIGSNPEAGTEVRNGTVITLIVST